MWLLLKAAVETRRHLILFLVTMGCMLLLTIANQLEMCALGALSNLGTNLLSDKLSSIGVENNPLAPVILFVKSHLHRVGDLRVLIYVLLGVAMFKATSLFFSRYLTQLIAVRVSADLRQKYFAHIQSLPMSFYQQYNSAALSSRVVGDAGQIALSLNACLVNYFQTPFTLVSTLFICFTLSWKLSLIIFIGGPLVVFPILFLAKKVKQITRQILKNQENFASVLVDFLAGIQTVKIFAMESFSRKKYEQQNTRMLALEKKAAKYATLARPILHAITTLCLASVLILGLYVLKMSLSELLVFCGMLHLVYEPIKKFSEENAIIQRGIAAAERMFEVLDQKSLIEDRDGALELDFQEKIEFDHVWFAYQDEWILRDLSFTVRKGETFAIVGPTGSGKSTIVTLLPRLYEVQKGEIRIDGRPISDYTQKSIRESIAFVAQKPFLFLDTIAANISFGRDFSQEKILDAAKKAYADEFIARLPKGYETELEETGRNLSGGQHQRLSIARALVKEAPILILDEATSSLDAISENRIKKAISELHGEMTQIIIAHRLGTIEHADRILYLDRGVKIAEGTKEELLENCPPFRQMWEALYNMEQRGELDPEEGSTTTV